MKNIKPSFNIPVLFTIFNRPDKTQIVFNAIKHRRPKYLFVAADGPRSGVPDDSEKCMKTRSIIEQIDWDCDCKTLFQNENKGCGMGMVTALNWFFSKVEKGIILEDDCLPHPDFFDYCENLLNHYENNEKVMIISGDNFQNGKTIGKTSYYYSAYCHIWGWASWKYVWEKFKYDINNLNEKMLIDNINDLFITKRESNYWINKYKRIKRISNPDFWDYQFTYSIWYNKGLSVIPNANLVTNIGFGVDATHTFDTGSVAANIPFKSIFPILHPQKINQDKKADKRYFKLYLKERYSVINRIKRIIKKVLKKT